MYTLLTRIFRWFGVIAGLLALATLACDERRSQERARAAAPAGSARIVSLAAGLSRLIVEFGLASQVVGVDSESRELPEFATSVDLGDSAQADAAAIAALEPRLVFALGDELPTGFVEALQTRGITVHVFAPTTANGVIQSIHQLGSILGREARASSAVGELTREISRIATQRDGERRLEVVWILERDPLTVVGNSGLLHEMLELAGGEMALQQLQGERVAVTVEALAASEPEVILDSTPESSGEPIEPEVILDSTPESSGEPIATEARTEALPTAIGEVPTLDLLGRIRFLHAVLYPSQ